MPPNQSRRLSCAGCALIALSAAYLAAVAALMLAQRYVGERVWFVTWVTYAPQHAAAIPVAPLLLWAVLARSSRAVLLNLASLAVVFFGLMGYCWHLDPGPGPDTLRVMTYNIHYLDGGLEPVARTIAAEKPDVVVLQEVSPRPGKPHPMGLIKTRLPQYRFASHKGLAVGSKYPIVHTEARVTWPEPSGRPALRVDVKARGRTVHIFAAHLAVAIDDELIEKRWSAIPSYTKHSTNVRSNQTRRLLDWTTRVNGPVILAGDFNTPPRGRIYGRIRVRYRDAFAAAGRGLGHTFRSDLPMLRIDYVFTSGGVKPRRAWVPDSHASDHKPLVAEVMLP